MSLQNPVFIPGPTNIPEFIRKACDMPTVDHRSSAFADMLHPIIADLKQVFGAHSAEIVIFPGTGTAGWEAAITNVLSPTNTVLATRHGMFSQRWIDLCQRHGLSVHVIDAEWGEGAAVEQIAARLLDDRSHEIRAVLATHNETATGVKSDIGAIRKALDAAEHPALLLVDGVSSIASMPFAMEEWGVDVAVTGSQKGLMLPAGLAILAISQKAMTAMVGAQLPSAYFDIRDMLKANAGNGYPYTPPLGLMNGLSVSLKALLGEGLDNVYKRHHRIAQGVRLAVAAWDLELCAKDPSLYSDTVSAVVVPPGLDGTAVVQLAAQKYQMAFGVGLGQVAGKVFRIGHLGLLTDAMALSGLATLEMCMADLHYPIRLGAGVAAAQEYYRQEA